MKVAKSRMTTGRPKHVIICNECFRPFILAHGSSAVDTMLQLGRRARIAFQSQHAEHCPQVEHSGTSVPDYIVITLFYAKSHVLSQCAILYKWLKTSIMLLR